MTTAERTIHVQRQMNPRSLINLHGSTYSTFKWAFIQQLQTPSYVSHEVDHETKFRKFSGCLELIGMHWALLFVWFIFMARDQQVERNESFSQTIETKLARGWNILRLRWPLRLLVILFEIIDLSYFLEVHIVILSIVHVVTVKASNFGPHGNFGPFFCKFYSFFG